MRVAYECKHVKSEKITCKNKINFISNKYRDNIIVIILQMIVLSWVIKKSIKMFKKT